MAATGCFEIWTFGLSWFAGS